MAKGVTPFWHQVRDQALHLVYGAVAGFVAAEWWQGALASAFYGAVREGEQWPTLNTPSVTDSAVDWTFVVLGGAAGALLRHLIIH